MGSKPAPFLVACAIEPQIFMFAIIKALQHPEALVQILTLRSAKITGAGLHSEGCAEYAGAN